MERFSLGNDFTLLFNFDFELVIIEDFSTDGTRDIVTDFQ
jgi:glycosyltransferase involved in cell wall biosynthesis